MTLWRRRGRGSADRFVILWDAASGQRLHTWAGHTARIGDVAFSLTARR